jgi:hypothetical protein
MGVDTAIPTQDILTSRQSLVMLEALFGAATTGAVVSEGAPCETINDRTPTCVAGTEAGKFTVSVLWYLVQRTA